MSHFSDIGFQIETPEQLDAILTSVITYGEVFRVPGGGAYVLWEPGAGIQLWVQTDENDQVVGVNPHFSGEGRLRVGVQDVRGNPDIPLDGSLIGWMDPPEAGAFEDGVSRCMLDMPDFKLVEERLQPGVVFTMQVAAFAHEMTCFSDEADFNVRSYQLEEGYGFAPQSFLPTGLFAVEQPTSEAFLAGHVLRVNRRYNPTSQGMFYHLVVRTLGGTVDLVADPALVDGEPQPGGLVQGSFWLVARVALDTFGGRSNGRAH